MKLFEITAYWDQYQEYNTYLTVGESELVVKEREKISLASDKFEYVEYHGIKEITEVNGYKIIVGDKIDGDI